MTDSILIGGYRLSLYTHDTIVIGSGASGYAAAAQLAKLGHEDMVIVTERRENGTSRNTGSDKQTYYKLTLSGGESDSVAQMAETLMSGRAVDGDLALCEAALSTRCFMHLVELGVPFPCNRYGEYVGYKTDHDPKIRATSAGPYTSKMMTEVLERDVMQRGIPIYDHMQVIRILTHDQTVLGVLCLDHSRLSDEHTIDKSSSPYVLFRCRNIIYATGGPAGIYHDSVYPFGHFGATGLALEAGVTGKNLTEWQYGLSSTRPRWNVSGTYMQCLPRFFSTEPDGSDEHEFLMDFFDHAEDMLKKVFLKGYQWPFDVRKIDDGSSIIDLLVYMETLKGRKVYLDFRQNPQCGIDYRSLSPEVKNYLENCHACFGSPYERLVCMNEPAAAFYKDHGVDLAKQPLEISLCAQHNNGGLSIDRWWQTNVKGFFCVGEASCSHGVYRPGGTALNAGQVGALRAAQFIHAESPRQMMTTAELTELARQPVLELIRLAESALSAHTDTVNLMIKEAQKRMSLYGAAFRQCSDMEALLHTTEEELSSLPACCGVETSRQLSWLFRLRDILICQRAYLYAMISYSQTCNLSRGSALYTDPHGCKPYECLPDSFSYRLEDSSEDALIQELLYSEDSIEIRWRSPRPLPTEENIFENVWRSFRVNHNID